MGRPISSERNQTLIDQWRRRILAVRWDAIRPTQGFRRFVSVLGFDPAEIDAELKNRLKAALEELRAVCIGLGEDNRTDQPSAALDAWIDRHLVAHGDDLLISDQRRRALLARLRDQDRRRSHSERGLRSARIELPANSWQTLKLIGAQWGTTTIAETLVRLIDTHADGKKPIEVKNVRAARKRREAEQTFLPGLSPGSHV